MINFRVMLSVALLFYTNFENRLLELLATLVYELV